MGDSSLIRGYDVHEKLGAGAMGEVFRATNRLNRQAVALKRMLSLGRRPRDLRHRLALMSEFQTSASLHHPHIIRVLDYGLDAGNQPFLAMELLNDPRSIIEAGRAAPGADQVQLLRQLLEALVYLHARGVVHRDIKPSNILVHEGAVKLSDFGVAAHKTTATKLVGTVAYMAPEVLHGGNGTPASDLYAVGVVAYELFHGHYPFDIHDVRRLLAEVVDRSAAQDTPVEELAEETHATFVGNSPEMRQVNNAMLRAVETQPVTQGPLSPLLDKLLSRDPQQRYKSAREVLDDLLRLSGTAAPVQQQQVRESFLQAAAMVGRDKELQALSTGLQRTMEGVGGGFLVGGESGVGKSRLIEELRTLSLVRGAIAVRGQAVNEGSSPFHLWRTALRSVCIHSQPEPDDASVLLDIIHDLDALLRHPIAAAAHLEPQAAQARLYSSVENLLRRTPQPLLLVLEDLQWAGPESIDLLRHLMTRVHELPVLLVGTFRNDERPDLPNEIPTMPLLKLGRLDARGVARLCESMLGPAGKRADVVEFLQREAEGNVFFMIEVARALAEAAGDLDRIGSAGLPEHILTGGIRQLVQRRLQAVGEADLHVLKIAAVAGRSLDTRLLSFLSGKTDLAPWLLRCANAAVFDWHEGSWRFAHDKLREAVLATLQKDEAIAFHTHVGNGIETLYAGEMDKRAASLAHHAAAAHLYERAALYSSRAGEVAERGHAPLAARHHSLAALSALSQLAPSPEIVRARADAVATYAHTSWTAESPDAMLQRLQTAEAELLALAPSGERPAADLRRLARLHLWSGRALHAAGQSTEAIGYYRRTLEMAEQISDADLTALSSVMIGQARVVQGYLNEWPLILKGLDYMRRQATFIDLTRAIGYVGFGLSAQGKFAEAQPYLNEAYDMACEQHNDRAIAFAAIYSAFARLMANDTGGAVMFSKRLRDGAHKSGDRILEFIGHGLLAWSEHRHGRRDLAAQSIKLANDLRTALGGKVVLGDWVAAGESEIILDGADAAAAVLFARTLVSASGAADAPLSLGIGERSWALALHKQQGSWAEVKAHLLASVQALEKAGLLMEAARTYGAGVSLAEAQRDGELAAQWRGAGEAILKSAT